MTDAAGTARPEEKARGERRGKGGFSPAALIVLAIVAPPVLDVSLGGLLVTPIRLCLVLLLIPALSRFARLEGGLRSFDVLYGLFVLWTVLAILINRGADGFERAGQFVLETFVVYIAVQAYCRTYDTLYFVVRLLIGLALLFSIMAIPEPLTGRHIYHEMMGTLLPINLMGGERYGTVRATTLFDHPIHHGIFCGTAIAWIFYSETRGRFLKIAVAIMGTFLSFSSGPLLVALAQLGSIAVERATRGVARRATIIFSGVFTMLAALELFTGRGIAGVVPLLVLSPHTAWYRITIWTMGWKDVVANPIFGIRPEDWSRLHWMSPSIDAYWLFQMLEGGLPSVIFLGLAIVLIARRLFRTPAERLSEPVSRLRYGWGFVMIAMALVGGTVHFFGSMQPFFALLIGLGAALTRVQAEMAEAAESGAGGAPAASARPLQSTGAAEPFRSRAAIGAGPGRARGRAPEREGPERERPERERPERERPERERPERERPEAGETASGAKTRRFRGAGRPER